MKGNNIIKTKKTIFIWAVLSLLVTEARSQNKEPYFGQIGEGYSASDFSERIVIGSHLFPAPDNAAMCAAAPKPTKLKTNKNEYIIKVGDIFSPKDLRVVAVDADGKILKPTPIIFLIEVKTPEVWVMWDTKLKRETRSLHDIRALKSGNFRIRIKPFCELIREDLFINFIIKDKT
jgi:hypothetical protein